MFCVFKELGFKLSLFFLVVLLFDGLILPAFFGFRESFLSMLVLIAFILYLGPTQQSIVYGFVFALISESLRGLSVGDLTIPFLFTAAAVYLTQRFLDIKYTFDVRFGLDKLALIALMSVVFIYVLLFLYRYGSVNIEYFSPVIGLTIVAETLILVFVFNVVFNNKSDYK